MLTAGACVCGCGLGVKCTRSRVVLVITRGQIDDLVCASSAAPDIFGTVLN